MIQMFLSPGHVESGHALYPHQGLVQGILVSVAILSIPIMLCVKPCWRNHTHKREARWQAQGQESVDCAPEGERRTHTPIVTSLQPDKPAVLIELVQPSAIHYHFHPHREEDSKEDSAAETPETIRNGVASPSCSLTPLLLHPDLEEGNLQPEPRPQVEAPTQTLPSVTTADVLAPSSDNLPSPMSVSAALPTASALPLPLPFDFRDELIHQVRFVQTRGATCR